ncbi:replication-associated recombination protein A [Limosilactobacillus fastidiosus]|uniref:Replication-associated recombination protein A n=1 Tax=Limosilactobacillus fastidiosus TaxID=2759855 RepID=A0ABR6E8T1_9LACO|nr:replication-associated recombination protein A [Limosilactobacillus fastidiosus]MBB1063377.1 replication-associated recombination protein A [Limosilactobacillus fastidiosus]MCD7084645.1 replication-associated recombination protein A [Limosilactobacillus fastidiosus]
MHQESLFSHPNNNNTPLANRVRPTTLKEFMGQQQLIGNGKVLHDLIETDQVSSLIFWGPPGVGKTTLAEIIAHQTNSHFITFSAVTSSIRDIRKIMEEAEKNREFGERTICFIDEIHRFNKAQQDAFLPFVERGSIILIGATTENPSFEINSALLSRCKVFVLKSLAVNDIVNILKRAIKHPNGFPTLNISYDNETLKMIAEFANGDARVALNTLEMAILNANHHAQQVQLTIDSLKQFINTKSLRYDQHCEEHYNVISALHKAMRNSDVDAAIYWYSRMINGGEDPLYIARRLIRFASEDIGLADTNALNIAINTFQACQFLGLPECDVHLTECVIYLSLAPKSNSTYEARMTAKKIIKETGNLPVPLQIRNAPTKLMKELHYGDHYQYAHNTKDKLTSMKTMPPELVGHHFYKPTTQGREGRFKARMEQIKEWHRQHDHD